MPGVRRQRERPHASRRVLDRGRHPVRDLGAVAASQVDVSTGRFPTDLTSLRTTLDASHKGCQVAPAPCYDSPNHPWAESEIMTARTLHTIILCIVVQAVGCAWYADDKGFSPGAIFLAALFLGFPLVVLAIAIGVGLKPT